MVDRPGRADLHIHTVASDGIADIVSIVEAVSVRGELDVIAITDHERIDAALAGRECGPCLECVGTSWHVGVLARRDRRRLT